MPGTDLNAAVIVLGTGSLGSAVDRQTSFQMLDAYLEAEGNIFDTAKVYADWLPGERSVSEKTIGAWMAARKNRSRLIVSTKGAHPDLATMNVQRLSPVEIVSDLEASLRHLGVETIDLYWLHRDDPARPVEEILGTLNRQVEAGKIRYFGASNWRLKRLKEAQAWAVKSGVQGFAANQIFWNIGEPDPERIPDKSLVFMDPATWRYQRDKGLAAVAYTSQANGYFTRRVRGEPVSDQLLSVYHLAENEARIQRIQALAHQTGLTPSQIGLGYLTSQPFPAYAIIGCKTMAQLADSLSAADVQLTSTQVEGLVWME
jgi:aryl-alcohol dehydrogenase-like predicted oxidoreductase